MVTLSLSPARSVRVLTLAATAAASLYMGMIFVIEPMRSLAATMASIDVDVTIPSSLALTCGGGASGTVSLGSLTAGTSRSASGSCIAITNGAAGYTLRWQMTTGSGGFGTGHLNSYIKNASTPGGRGGYQIRAMHPTAAGTPQTFDTIAHGCPSCAATEVRWGGRIRANSTSQGGAGMPDFGTDTAQKFLNVGTGSVVSLVKTTAPTAIAGDTEYVQFKAIAGASNVNAASTYKARVYMTIIDN